jgi:hypothetical protein
MRTEQLNKLLDTACEIISALEKYADPSLKNEINVFFDEIVSSDDIDDEMRINYSADDEAQDWDVFGDDKI